MAAESGGDDQAADAGVVSGASGVGYADHGVERVDKRSVGDGLPFGAKVELDGRAIRGLCAPVRVPWPGVKLRNAADSRHISMVESAHADLLSYCGSVGMEVPRNKGGPDLVARKLDCAVIQALHKTRNRNGDAPFDTVLAAFFEGEKLYENSGFTSRNHIQVCIRSHQQILGYFRPLRDNGEPYVFE